MNIKKLLYLLPITLLASRLSAAPIQEHEIPEALKPWQAWVSWSHRELSCPFLSTGTAKHCVWANNLSLDLHQTSGHFTYQVSVFAESQVLLPGNSAQWPSQLLINNAPAILLEHQGHPAVQLTPGSYTIAGDFRWQQLPDTLAIPPETGIIQLRLDGKPVSHPVLKQGSLWLKTQSDNSGQRQPEDSVKLRLFRLLHDTHPFTVESVLELQISGAQRELLLGKPLLEGFIPSHIESQLPTRLEPNGELRVQARPGSWQVRIFSRHVAPVSQLRPVAQAASWPTQEIWAFRAEHQLRVVEVSGPAQIDPRQVDLPENWSNLPAYLMKPQDTFVIQEIRRANQEAEADQLMLERNIWLDFDAQGYTLQDHITGDMNSNWRLSVDPALELGRVSLNGVPQFITQLPGSNLTGVEVRRGAIDLKADIRVQSHDHQLPAAGWGVDFHQLSSVLHLPPGWRLLAVSGVDNVPQSWLDQWTLYDLFLVLIASIAASRLWGWPWGIPTLITLGLTWHEPQAPQLVWLYLLASIALTRVAPAGKLQQWLRALRILGYLALVLILMPFTIYQARLGLHPQLERYAMSPAYTYAESMREPEQPLASPPSPMLARSISKMEGDASGVSKFPGKQKQAYRVLDEVDPNAIVQTGPGLPAWQWTGVDLRWNGPVSAGQTLNLYMLAPWQTALLRFLSIGLVLITTWRLLDREKRPGLRLPKVNQLMLAIVALPLLCSISGKSMADIPGQPLLDELQQRLTLPPDCLPQCASIQQMELQVDSSAYQATLEIHATEPVAIPLPVDVTQATPLRVVMSDQSEARLLRLENQLWLYVEKGISRMEIKVGLPLSTEAQIPLPLKPHHLLVDANGWSVEGIGKDQVPGTQLYLTRLRGEAEQPEGEREFTASNTLPAFFRVERELHLGNSWSISTNIIRQTPLGTAVTLHVPLVANESIISEGVQVKERMAVVSLTANQASVSWQSNLKISDQLQLVATDTDQWVEVWRVDVGPVWHLTSEGIPPVHHQDADGSWLPTWRPWPGEHVALSIVRPTGIEGSSITIDQSRLSIQAGQRISQSELTLRLRASRGGKHEIQLPADAEIQSVDIDNKRVTIRPEQGKLSLPVAPGEQVYSINWRQPTGMSSRWQSETLSLGVESVNANISVNIPEERWLLWVDGPRMGPAILFWSLLIVVLLAAVILGRSTASILPLSTLAWFLLGIGLTQVSILSGLAVVAWFLLLYYRSKLEAGADDKIFNLVQVGVVILTLIFISILFWSVQQGLLGYPSMQIEGNGSSAYELNWYQDRIMQAYPQVYIVSVPLLVYRGLMLLWALWLAFSLLSWLKWGWAAFSKGGVYWKEIKIELSKQRKPRVRKRPAIDAESEKPKPSST